MLILTFFFRFLLGWPAVLARGAAGTVFPSSPPPLPQLGGGVAALARRLRWRGDCAGATAALSFQMLPRTSVFGLRVFEPLRNFGAKNHASNMTPPQPNNRAKATNGLRWASECFRGLPFSVFGYSNPGGTSAQFLKKKYQLRPRNEM